MENIVPIKDACRLWDKDRRTLKGWLHEHDIKYDAIGQGRKRTTWMVETPSARYNRRNHVQTEIASITQAARMWGHTKATVKSWAINGDLLYDIIKTDNRAFWFIETPDGRQKRVFNYN